MEAVTQADKLLYQAHVLFESSKDKWGKNEDTLVQRIELVESLMN